MGCGLSHSPSESLYVPSQVHSILSGGCNIRVSAASVSASKTAIGLLDSGANGCITGDISLFTGAVLPVQVSVEGIHGGLRATGVGTAVVPVSGYHLPIDNMFYVPGFGRTIISVGVLVDDGFTGLL